MKPTRRTAARATPLVILLFAACAAQPDAGAGSPLDDGGVTQPSDVSTSPTDSAASGSPDGAPDASACTPSCEARECGDDGCGGDCGACETGHQCTPDGACECAPHQDAACLGQKVVWVDGCGNAGETKQVCPPGTECEAGKCQTCQPTGQLQCAGGNVAVLDTCGHTSTVAVQCSDDEVCVDAECAPATSPYNGDFLLVADPPTVAGATLPEMILTVALTPDDKAELTLDDGSPEPTVLGGALNGQSLSASSSSELDEPGGTLELLVLNVLFSTPDTFAGTLRRTTDPGDGTPPSNVTWDVTGTRQ